MARSPGAAAALRAAGEPGDGHLFAAALHLGGTQVELNAENATGTWPFHREK